ncbi:hypothetical protein Q4530_01145 [Colwellia sp. 1_MG-2023]|uniref:hypothetical protein n=1 Tax=unclassified Colwellia TaxID=196834 RepID=UPI001C0809BA|nr:MULTISPECIES: hypothetical protein [unclassified Colwellia]MBU2925800.1 hypothetical protein [Colwellia sp. C2M11]MDO6650973.1 hypothetical protein [Colwellia sp. 3_MG-2023]MDO6664008.1 hypothetical protein [Colwellia sp. 2_MG-2023]MDO6688359.1 hypothetical protein [Colwellia sp. 1_MG-2023]
MLLKDVITHIDKKTDGFEVWSLKSFSPQSLVRKILKDDFSINALEAEKIAVKCERYIVDIINKKIIEYDLLGVHPPVFWLQDGALIGTYNHKQSDIKFDWVESKDLYQYIRLACPNKMLLISVLYLISRGFCMQHIVDGGNDGGIDIIAKSKDRTKGIYLEERVLFVQSKKCSKTLDKKILIYEDAFFKDNLKKGSDFRNEYLEKLGMNTKSPTLDISYIFITNGLITSTIRDYSIRNNIQLLNPHVLSHTLMSVYSKGTVIDKIERWFNQEKYKRGTSLFT